jgi:WD40 repeat protein
MAIPATKIPGPPGQSEIGSVAWFPTGQIVVEASNQIWFQPPQSDSWHQLLLSKNPKCKGTGFFQLSALPDGRLGMLCPADLKNQRIIYALVAYDWTSDTLAPLIAEPLPDTGQFTWDPTLSRGVFSTVGSYSTLFWLTAAGTEPVTITLTDGAKSWFLPDSIIASEQYNPANYRDPHSVGNVGDIAWSPVGDRIAFWATLEPIGQPYNLLRQMAWTLYMLDSRTMQVKTILKEVYDPISLAWSPDGQWLMYTTGQGNNQPEGVWLISPRTGRSRLMLEGHYQHSIWSPDGSSIVSILCSDKLCKTTELWKYDVSGLVAHAK